MKKNFISASLITFRRKLDSIHGNQIGHCIDYGGEKVPITREDMKKIKNFDTPGLKLMGFKPQSKLK